MTWDSTARASAAASPSERISATEVRRAVRSGQRLEDLVDPAVAAYIYGAGLYRANSCARHRQRDQVEDSGRVTNHGQAGACHHCPPPGISRVDRPTN